jgi:hypothetical protein
VRVSGGGDEHHSAFQLAEDALQPFVAVQCDVLRVFIADAAEASVQLPHPERCGTQPAGEGEM